MAKKRVTTPRSRPPRKGASGPASGVARPGRTTSPADQAAGGEAVTPGTSVNIHTDYGFTYAFDLPPQMRRLAMQWSYILRNRRDQMLSSVPATSPDGLVLLRPKSSLFGMGSFP